MRLSTLSSSCVLFLGLALAGCGDDDAMPSGVDAGGGGMDAGGGGTDAGTPEVDAGGGACRTACRPGQICCPVGFGSECLAPRATGECPLPDLTVNTETLRRDLSFTWENFTAEDCALVEGCILTPGWRRLMRFSTQTPNIGDADMHLGVPSASSPSFEYSSCHMHYHFNGYADYRLLDSTGAEVGQGHKQAFCLLDSEIAVDVPATPRTARYTCGDQGIQRGWSDVYPSGLDCQWIDVTDITPGMYTLRVNINIERELPESSYDNNQVEIIVTVPPDTSSDPTVPCTGAPTGPSRDCGWTVERSATCTPGSMVEVGCGTACMHGTGCRMDPMLRICPGSTPCGGRYAITSDDDSCGDYCPLASFTCPTEGRYTILTGSYDPTAPATCRTTSTGGGPGADAGVDAGPPAASDAGVPEVDAGDPGTDAGDPGVDAG